MSIPILSSVPEQPTTVYVAGGNVEQGYTTDGTPVVAAVLVLAPTDGGQPRESTLLLSVQAAEALGVLLIKNSVFLTDTEDAPATDPEETA